MTRLTSQTTENGGNRIATVQTRIRREHREDLVRYAEYSAFPRVSSDQRERVGFTCDLSDSGLCLRVENAEALGSLLRVVVRDVDDRPTLQSIARVAWTRPARDGSWWLGLTLVDGRRNVGARPAAEPRERSVSGAA